jgi:hypothetical protein
MAMRKPIANHPPTKAAKSRSSRLRSASDQDAVVTALADYEKKPKGSEERFQAFRKVLKAVHDEHAD